jgi:hypothetical protein
MGYGIMPYCVKMDRVERAFGSHDGQLEAAILSEHGRRMARMDSNFDDTPMADILHDFIAGTVSYPQEGYKYWYAIEMIMQSIGQMLPNGAWYPADIDALWSLQGCRLYSIQTAVKIPSPDDFPTVFIIRNADIDAARTDAQSKMKDAEQLAEFETWCNRAHASASDLALYYY